MGEHIHQSVLTKLPEGLLLDLAALLGCAVLTGVVTATDGCADFAFEVIDVPTAQKQAFQVLRCHGKLVLMGSAPFQQAILR